MSPCQLPSLLQLKFKQMQLWPAGETGKKFKIRETVWAVFMCVWVSCVWVNVQKGSPMYVCMEGLLFLLVQTGNAFTSPEADISTEETQT